MIIDAHVHCGKIDPSAPQAYEDIAPEFDRAGVDAAVCFSPVMEIYDRHNPGFADDADWKERRRSSRRYLLSLAGSARRHRIYPFCFVWNDFDAEGIEKFCGIKWHRHEKEPEYDYGSPGCARMIEAIRENGFAVLLEETYENTLRLVDGIGKGIPFIIPHLGMLNGGIRRLREEDFWKRGNTYADASAVRETEDIRKFVEKYGPHRLIYGSDYPFASPADCRARIEELNLPPLDEKLVFSGNILRLLKNVQSRRLSPRRAGPA